MLTRPIELEKEHDQLDHHYRVYVAEGKADMLEEEGYLAEVSWRIYTVVND